MRISSPRTTKLNTGRRSKDRGKGSSCGIDCGAIERVQQGLVVTLRPSKTDQDGVGREIGIPLGRSKWCPVTAFEVWLEAAEIEAGPVFRPVDRHGRIASERLSGETVSLIVKERIVAAGIDPAGFSGHSLRAGISAFQNDVAHVIDQSGAFQQHGKGNARPFRIADRAEFPLCAGHGRRQEYPAVTGALECGDACP